MSEPPSGPPRVVTLAEIRRAARRRLPCEAWNLGAGGAETETPRRQNRRDLDRLAIQQTVLVDVREIDLRASLLGVSHSWSVEVAPLGGLVLFHPEGDAAMARGTARAADTSCGSAAPPGARSKTSPGLARDRGCSSSTITATAAG